MIDNEILQEVIKGHRKMLSERYDYERIKANYKFPLAFTEEKVVPLRTYFLEYVYPDLDKRQELEAAFESLDNHLKHPEHLGRIVLDSASLLFKYGLYLPKILSSGLKALKSFRSASKVEKVLAEEAVHSQISPPYGSMEIKNLMSKIPRRDLDILVDNSVDLYDILFDRTLVKKIIQVIDYIILKMKKRPNVYAIEEIRGLELGREIIAEGDLLIKKLNIEEQAEFMALLEQIERDAVEEVESLRMQNEH